MSEEQKGKRLKKSKQNPRHMWDTIKWTNINMWKSQNKREEAAAEKLLEEIMAENSKLDKNYKPVDQRSSVNPKNKKHE